jgi:hypothetical protein
MSNFELYNKLKNILTHWHAIIRTHIINTLQIQLEHIFVLINYWSESFFN